MAHTGVVPQLAGSVCVSSSPSTHEPVRSSRADTSPDCEPDSLPRRVACIKQFLRAEGICAGASGLILGAWRPGTNAVYNSTWKKWHSWCFARESDSFRPALTDITSFLSDCFNEGLEYRTLNTYRSVLSGVLLPMDGSTSFGCSFAKRRPESSTHFASLSAFLECGHSAKLLTHTSR